MLLFIMYRASGASDHVVIVSAAIEDNDPKAAKMKAVKSRVKAVKPPVMMERHGAAIPLEGVDAFSNGTSASVSQMITLKAVAEEVEVVTGIVIGIVIRRTAKMVQMATLVGQEIGASAHAIAQTRTVAVIRYAQYKSL